MYTIYGIIIYSNYIMEPIKVTKMNSYEEIKEHAVEGLIYCHCVYSWKDNLKKLGFKWSPKYKLWYIPVSNFTNDIYEQTQVIRFTNQTSIGPLHYYYVYYMSKYDISKYDIKQEPNKTHGKKHDFSTYAF